MTIKYSSLLPVFCTKTGRLLPDEERHRRANWDKVSIGDVVEVSENTMAVFSGIIIENGKSRANELGCLFNYHYEFQTNRRIYFIEKEPSMRDFQAVPSKCSNPVIPMHVGRRFNDEGTPIAEGLVSVPATFGGDELYTPCTTKSKFHQEPFDDKPFGYEKITDR